MKERYRVGNRILRSPQFMLAEVSFDASEESETRLRFSRVMHYKPVTNAEIDPEMGKEQISRNIRPGTYSGTCRFAGYRFSF